MVCFCKYVIASFEFCKRKVSVMISSPSSDTNCCVAQSVHFYLYFQSTNSSDKRRWSFRRKSTSQRVIIHTVDANTSSGDRDSMDLVDQLIAPRDSSSVMHLNNEESNMSMNVYNIDSSENQLSITANVEESAVTLIQTTVRRFLVITVYTA